MSQGNNNSENKEFEKRTRMCTIRYTEYKRITIL